MSDLRAGQVVLAGTGVSTCLPALDFETYSEAGFVWNAAEQCWDQLPGIAPTKKKGLPTVGLYNYVRHPSFEVLSLVYNLKDGHGPVYWRPGLPTPQRLIDHVVRLNARDPAAWPLEAWNMEFETEVWNTYCVRAFEWPTLPEFGVRCAMAKAAAQSYPRALKWAGPALHLPPSLFKDERGEKLVNKLTVPCNPTKKHPNLRWTRAELPEEFAAFDAYNVQDEVTESACSIRIKDQSPRELRIWQMDQATNRRGMQIDIESNEACIKLVEQLREKYNAQIRFITNGHASGYTKAADIMRWAATQGSHFNSLDEDTLTEELTKPHPQAVLDVLKLRQRLSFGSVNKCYAIRAQVGADGRLRGQYAYHGAHTALWNGQNVQVANLYKPSELWAQKPEGIEKALAAIRSGSLDYVEALYGDGMECIANCLRSLIIAGPGKDLIAADYSAIQAVVLAALAGEDWRTEVFRTHGKIYEMTAASITGKSFQFYLDYKRENGVHHNDRNPYGKIPELSAGFASWIGGWKKFGAGDFMDDQQIKAAILKWREASPWIVEFWGGQVRNKFQPDERAELYGLEGAAVAAVLHPGRCFGYRNVRYIMHGDALYCQPPTDGDPLVYHEPRLEPSTRDWARPYELSLSYMGWNSNQTKGRGGWVRMPLYGGVATQNVVAKVSREFQADALVGLEDTGIYLPVMHTHDENVCEVDKDKGAIDEYLGIVNRRKPWAHHYDGKFIGQPWPVKAPGAERTQRYGKWE